MPEQKWRLKIQHLLTLVALGRHQNAHQAARALGVSQPAISKNVSEVENVFGVTLFERGRAGMIPNRMGEALIARAIALLNDLDRTQEEIAAIAAGQFGSLRLGVIAFTLPSLIPRTLNKLKEADVSLVLEVQEDTTQPLVDKLLRNEIDCIIGRYSTKHEDRLDQTFLAQQSFTIAVSSTHPLLTLRRGVRLRDVLEYDWIVTPPNTAARQSLISMFTAAGLRMPTVRVETASMEVMRATLSDCGMIGLLPKAIAARDPGLREILISELRRDFAAPPLMLIRRRDELTLPSVERFCRALIDVAADMAKTEPPGRPGAAIGRGAYAVSTAD